MVNRFIKYSHCALFLFLGVSVPLILLGTTPAQSATYYVATTGNDSNPGTSSKPWRNPQKCALSPIKAGDTCIVRAGTYSDSNGDGVVVYVYPSNSPPGTASQPITIKSEKLNGAVIVVPSDKNGFGFIVKRPYYIIEGFDISGGNYSGSSGAGIGINILSGGNGVTIRSNSIHHIGRKACTDSTNGYAGIVVREVSGVLVERNRIYSVGRKRKGESGCSTIRDSLDHGVYITRTSSVTVRRNVIYDTNRGYPIHVYRGTTTNLSVHHNTLSGKSPTGKPNGHILLSSTITTANIKNNISIDAQTGMINLYNLSASKVNITHNMSNTTTNGSGVGKSGVTFSNNFEKISNLGLSNKSTNDFRLTSGSPAINRGTTLGVPPVPDQAPDISAYEYSVQNSSSSPLTPTGLRTF